MHKLTVALALLIFVVTVNARHFKERSIPEPVDDTEGQIDHVRRAREHGANQMRHKRRSWQTNYGYDYPQPPNPYYPDNRRQYDQNQQDYLPQIYRLLDEISSYVRRPPAPPQPIYIPYPVPYPVPQRCNCQPKRPTQPTQPIQPNITSRFPDMEDTNQNWGFVETDDDSWDVEGDGSRPISFDPIVPKRPPSRPQPKVEHGSSQAGSYTTQSPRVLNMPSLCDVSALSCCSGTAEQQIQCFNNSGCGSSYNNGNACRKERLLAIIDAYAKAYSPVN